MNEKEEDNKYNKYEYEYEYKYKYLYKYKIQNTKYQPRPPVDLIK